MTADATTTRPILRTKFWTDERAERCRAMWAAGRTSADIADELGCSRGVVMGKVGRMGWTGPHSFGAPKPAARQKPRARPKPARAPQAALAPAAHAYVPAPDVAPGGPGRPLVHLQWEDCRWPVSEVTPGRSDFLFCAMPRVDAEAYCPYCPDHARVAYNGRMRR